MMTMTMMTTTTMTTTTKMMMTSSYGVALARRLLKIIGLFCKRAL